MYLFLWCLLSLYLLSSSTSTVIREWTDAELELADETASVNRLFLFYADWCSACRRIKPKFIGVAPKLSQLEPSLEIIQVNLEKAPLLASRFRVSHLPSLFHQIDGQFWKVDTFRDKLEKYFEGAVWKTAPHMGPLSPAKVGKAAGNARNHANFNIFKAIEDSGVSLPVFVILIATILLFIVLFIIWGIWLYTDYKLNAHNFTEEAIKERIKVLRKHPDFEGEFLTESGSEEEKDDSGNESDSEENAAENVPLRGRRSSLKNRLKK